MRGLLVGCVMWCSVVVVGAGCSKPDGSACQSDGECAVDSRCVYKIADGCAAMRTCQPSSTGPTCDIVLSYCGCDGGKVGVGCQLAAGYAPAPVRDPNPGSCESNPDGGSPD